MCYLWHVAAKSTIPVRYFSQYTLFLTSHASKNKKSSDLKKMDENEKKAIFNKVMLQLPFKRTIL